MQLPMLIFQGRSSLIWMSYEGFEVELENFSLRIVAKLYEVKLR